MLELVQLGRFNGIDVHIILLLPVLIFLNALGLLCVHSLSKLDNFLLSRVAQLFNLLKELPHDFMLLRRYFLLLLSLLQAHLVVFDEL